MRVLHINTLQHGGAAQCVFRLNKALLQEGVDSRVLIAEGDIMPEGVEGAIARQDKSIWNSHRLLLRVKKKLARLGWSPVRAEKMREQLQQLNTLHFCRHQPLSLYKNIAHHPLVEWADIIHLHWVADLVDYPTFFKEVRKPIVWTLHDKYPAEGVQHYTSAFFPLPEKLKAFDSRCKTIKRRGVEKARNMTLVAISEPMADACKQSDILKRFPVTHIHNGVDTNIFRPYDKGAVRKELGLDREACIFLFSAYVLHDPNKGLDRILQALEKIGTPRKMLLCVGKPSNEQQPVTSIPVIQTGLLTSQSMMAKYYAAADYFVQCAYEESFGQTVIEAMACGTPVISTPCGIAPELVHPFNGVLCKGYDSDAIAMGITEAMGNHYESHAIRQYILDHYRYELIAKQYIELYGKCKKQITSDR